MIRSRRSVPWIYRWSRPIIGVLAIAGAVLTAYLTIAKLTGGDVACGAGSGEALETGCKSVLDSPYAIVFGLPLSLFGFLAYSSMSVASLGPLLIKPEGKKTFRKQLDEWTWLFLLAGGTSMAIFSGYLMYILATELQSLCYYCIGSALFSLALMGLSIFGRYWEEVSQLFFIPIVVAMITLVGTLAIYAPLNQPTADGRIPVEQPAVPPQAPYGWKITPESGSSEIELAEHLTSVDAKMYGAFWCNHCFNQKQVFGQEAFEKISYIECDPRGKNPQTDACVAAEIQSYPTWVINGEKLSGAQLPETLAQESSYTGSTDFKYTIPGR